MLAGKAQAHPGIKFRTTRVIGYLQLPAGFEHTTLRLTAKGSTTVMQLLVIDCTWFWYPYSIFPGLKQVLRFSGPADTRIREDLLNGKV